jgi:uncharacterized integral membrane protein
MIIEALRDKLTNRGPGGFVYDSAELAIGCIVVGVYSLALGTAAIGGVVVGGMITAAMWVGEMAEYRER